MQDVDANVVASFDGHTDSDSDDAHQHDARDPLAPDRCTHQPLTRFKQRFATRILQGMADFMRRHCDGRQRVTRIVTGREPRRLRLLIVVVAEVTERAVLRDLGVNFIQGKYVEEPRSLG